MTLLQVFLLFTICACTYASLTDLYNSDVTYAEYYTRYINSGWWSRRKRSSYLRLHAGVVVTTSNGNRWLIHRSSDYGDAWNTVITSARHMSSSWTREKCGNVYGHTVNDFMQAGLVREEYDLCTSNCRHAANGMWDLVVDTPC